MVAIKKSFCDLIDKKQKATGTEFLIANLKSKKLFLRIIVANLQAKNGVSKAYCCHFVIKNAVTMFFLCMQIFKNAVYKAYRCVLQCFAKAAFLCHLINKIYQMSHPCDIVWVQWDIASRNLYLFLQVFITSPLFFTTMSHNSLKKSSDVCPLL